LTVFLIIAFLAASWKECQDPFEEHGLKSGDLWRTLEIFGLLDRNFEGKT